MRPPRPRDAAGRPLPYDADGVPPVEDRPRAPDEALDEARGLVAAGRPFAAHEVLEGVWKRAPDGERDLWRGLAQLAVGLTHLQRANPVGGARLLRRGADLLASYGDQPLHGLDLPEIVARARRRAAAADSAAAADDRS